MSRCSNLSALRRERGEGEGGREGERERERVEECGCRETNKWEIWRCVG